MTTAPLPPWRPLASPDLSHLHAAIGLSDSPQAPNAQATEVRLPNGSALRGMWFEPPMAARGVALVAPATGVPQRFYAGFARWLAQQGYAVLTLDYRGLGQSRAAGGAAPGGASMRDWMLEDLPAALRHVLQRAEQGGERRLPVLWVGHSLGGHALPLQPDLAEVDAALCIGAQLPSAMRWPPGHARWGAAFFFKRWLPWVVGLFGRLPAWALGGGEALPAAAAMDWSRWGQMPNYFASDPAMAHVFAPERFRGVAHCWCISDDWVFGPEPAVQALVDAFASAPGHVHLQRLRPAEVGRKRLGHFAPFSRQAGAEVWPLVLARLEAAVPALRARA